MTKRVGQLARVIDWAMRRELVAFATNPVRLLPKGYASVGHADEHALYHGERDRVLSDTEEGAIRKVLIKKEEHLLFTMALETAMRLSEMFTLKKEDADVARRTIFLDRTKTSRQGRSGKRQVPITSVLLEALNAWDGTDDVWMFPMWWTGGDAKERKERSSMISHLFARRFKQARRSAVKIVTPPSVRSAPHAACRRVPTGRTASSRQLLRAACGAACRSDPG